MPGALTLDLGACLKAEPDRLDTGYVLERLRALPPGTLPLGTACTQGGLVDDRALDLSLLSTETDGDRVRMRVGVFFVEVVGGCSCHDDPVPTPAYAILQVDIARPGGLGSVALETSTDID